MHHLITTVIALSLFICCASSIPTEWGWITRGGGTSTEEIATTYVDNQGNCYVTGYFTGTSMMGSNVINNRGAIDMYVVKVNANGDFLWAACAGGSQTDIGTGIAVDNSGNVYVVGFFNSALMYFGNGSNMYLQRTLYSNDVFVAKLSPSGTWLWARKAGGPASDIGNAIAIDADSNVIITGTFEANALFAPLPPVVAGSYGGYNDVFIAKIDESGNFLWVTTAVGANNESALKMTTDSANDIYICGFFASGLLRFDQIILQNSSTLGTRDAFIAKVNSNGCWQWAIKSSSAGDEGVYDIVTDSEGNVYFIGSMQFTTNFGILESVSAYGVGDLFVCKTSTQGDWLWVNNAGGPAYDSGWGIAVDTWSNVYLTGEFKGTAQFGETTLNSGSASNADIFLARMNANTGEWISAERVGSPNFDVGKDVCMGPDASVYWVGNFTGSISFGNNTITSNSNSQDIFVAKQISKPLRIVSPNGGEAWLANTTQAITWDSENVVSIKLDYSIDGDSTWIPVTNSAISASMGSYTWTVPNVNSNQVRVKIKAANEPENYDTSDFNFSISSNSVAPTPDFAADITEGEHPLAVTFTDSSLPGAGVINAWSWDFGDGAYSIDQNPSHTYTEVGLYSVSLTVTNSYEQTSTLTRNNYITVTQGSSLLNLISSDSLDFGSIQQGSFSEYQYVQFSNIGSANLVITDMYLSGSSAQFEFSAPNTMIIAPGTSISIPLRFAPQTSGYFTAEIVIVNSSDNIPVLSIQLSGTGTYAYDPPKADFSVDIDFGLYPLAVRFTDNSQAYDGALVSWFWDFGDGSSSTEQNPEHVFEFAGLFTISLTVTDSHNLDNILIIHDCIRTIDPSINLDLVSDNLIDFSAVYVGNTSDFSPVRLLNDGNADMYITDICFNGASQSFQYYASNEALMLSPGEVDTVWVNFGPLYEGQIEDRLSIIYDTQDNAVVDVFLYGTGVMAIPLAPQNLGIYREQTNIHLYWDPVSYNSIGNPISVDYYIIYVNGLDSQMTGFSYCGTSFGTTFTQYYVTHHAAKMFYYVVAVDLIEGELLGRRKQLTDAFLEENLIPGMTRNEVESVLSRAQQQISAAL